MKQRACALASALCLSAGLLCGCGRGRSEPLVTVDPYEGMISVESGYGTKMWITEWEEVPVNPLTAADFIGGEYHGSADISVKKGIDVSEHQGRIDWAQVAASGIDFAILRAGYRGYGEAGTMRRDVHFQENMTGAMENGVEVGVYFFSQATTPQEAEEEATFLLESLSAYPPDTLDFPVYYDWEDIGVESARTDGLTGDVVTDCAIAFCDKLEEAGYTTGVYAYRNLGYFVYDLRELTDRELWIATIGSYPDFYYAHRLWQYSAGGTVPGIEGNVDLDYWFDLDY